MTPGTLVAEPVEDVAAATTPDPGTADRLLAWVRANRLMAAALALAAALRLLVAVAYAPALEFNGDSYAYLRSSRQPFRPDLWHPIGYPVLLWILSITREIASVTLVQHLMGLAAGVLVYRLVRRLGVGSIGGVLAAAPVLFDAYQLDVEQFVLSDTTFTLLALVAVTLAVRLLDGRRFATAVAVGGVLGIATLTRTVGLAFAAVVLVTLMLARVGWRQVVTAAVAFAVPVGCYVLAFHATYGVYAMQGYSGRYLYGNVAPFAECRAAALPVDVRALCPTLPTYARPGVNQYVWEEFNQAHLPGDSIERSRLAGEFAKPVASRQRGQLVEAGLGNVVHYFEPGRQSSARDWYVGTWQFPLRHDPAMWNLAPANEGFRPGDRVHGHVNPGLAAMLRGYQRVFFTPGPALLAALVLAPIACVVRRDRRDLRWASVMLVVGGVAMLVVPSFSAGFDWRYLLPAQALLLPATVVAAAQLRPRSRAFARRSYLIAAAAAATALVAVDLPAASVYAASTLVPQTAGTAPSTRPLGSRAAVHVGAPTFIGVRCWASRAGHNRRWLVGLVAFPTAVTYRSGAPLLVQQANITFDDGDVTFPGDPPAGRPLRDVLLSTRYRQTSGTTYAYVHSDSGIVRYVDPFGAGAAAWRFHVSSPSLPAPLGTTCTGTTPWAGVRLPGLRVLGVAPFTVLPDQVVGYGLRHAAWRADTYDLRFHVASATAGPGPWQYPRTWQRTTATQQTLLNLTPGATYCFSVRARDAVGAVTDWSTPTCTARLYDDTALPKSPDWTTVTGRAGFYYGSYTATKTQGATIAVSGMFSRVALTAYRCPTCGTLQVFLGAATKPLATIDLSSTPARQGLTQWTSPLLPSQQTTLTLKVVSKNRLVAIDGFGLQR